MGGIKKFLKGGRESEPIRYLEVGEHAMSITLARRVWVMRHKPTGFWYSVNAISCVKPIGLASWFYGEQDALLSLARMEVELAQHMEPVNLYSVIAEKLGVDPVDSGEARDDFEDMGLIDPGIV